MAIIQISQIQQRTGNLVDLPQLNEAEFGWASDTKQLFIGKTVPAENVEVLTAYSNIAFSQITGAVGNLNITASVANGEVLTFDGTNWVNRGGNAGGFINLGNVSNVHLGGGTNGYVLQTDGTGNLSWTAQTGNGGGNGTPGGATTQIQFNSAGAFGASANFTYNSSSSLLTVNGNANVGNLNASSLVSASLFSSNIATGTPPLSVQSSTQVPNLYATYATTVTSAAQPNITSVGTLGTLTVTGNANVGNIGATQGVFINVSGNGSALSSLTGANVSGAVAFATTANGVAAANIVGAVLTANALLTNTSSATSVYPTFVTSLSNGYSQQYVNSAISANLANGSVTATTFIGNVIGNISGNFIVNGSNTDVLFNDSGAANATGGFTFNKTSNLVTVNGNLVSSNANLGNLVIANHYQGVIETPAQPNITSLGTLNILNVAGVVTAPIFQGAFNGDGSGLSTLPGANVTGAVAYATTANSVAGANVSGTVANANNSSYLGGASAASYLLTNGTGAGLSAITGANVTGYVANATYANTSGNVSHGIFFSNNGLGAGSGIGFDGTATTTISYNTIGALGVGNFTGSNQSLTTTGYQVLPGGLKMAWGTVTMYDVTNGYSYNFPTGVNFNTVFGVQLTVLNTSGTQGGGGDFWAQLVSFTPSSFRALLQSSNSSGAALPVFYLAFGF